MTKRNYTLWVIEYNYAMIGWSMVGISGKIAYTFLTRKKALEGLSYLKKEYPADKRNYRIRKYKRV